MLIAQSCLSLCDRMDCSPPGSSDHGILQARMLSWVAIPFSRGSSQLRVEAWVSSIASRFFTVWAKPGPKDEAMWASEETQPTVAWLCLHLLPPTKKYIWTGGSESDIWYRRKLESTLKSKSLANINQMVLWAIISRNHSHILHCRSWHASANRGQPLLYQEKAKSSFSSIPPFCGFPRKTPITWRKGWGL